MRFVFILVLVLSQGPPSAQTQREHAGTQQQTGPNQRGTPQSPAFVKLVPPDSSEAQRGKTAKEKTDRADSEWRIATATVALAVFTFLLAIGTSVLAVFTYNLWRATKDAAAEQAKLTVSSLGEMRRAAEAALSGADAAGRSATVAEKSLTRLERPYVFATIPAQDIWTDPMGQRDTPLLIRPKPEVRFSLRNYGRTPAIVREIRADVQVVTMVDAIIPRDKFWASSAREAS